ncbi:hypothetical protein DN407_18655 [Bacillus sp. JAS24-2]|uniref:hypothetical protein n=1 Tax=Bacillus sp. JAS24-2 TaxID=2217832 RepID=UPI0011EDF12A|nr:hypothetical protein [Bacillus sp. JAS24-2]QEL80536.1 hypothetical protein DN407_18655 [Bacillus sp. JAS24-2]
MASVWDVDSWVDRKVNSFIKSFYPTVVARELELPLSDVFERLLHLVKGGKLNIKWEVRCPDCSYTIMTLDEFPMSIPSTVFCTRCQDDIDLLAEQIFPIFEFNPDYRQYIRNSAEMKKKKGVRPSKMNKNIIEPASVIDSGLYNEGSLALIKELSPGWSKFLEGNQGIININISMEGNQLSKYDFSNANIDAKENGQVVIGEHQNVSHIVQNSKNATKTLLEELEKASVDPEVKQEMKEAIETVEQQVESGKPNKFMLKGIVEGLQKGIDLITKSPALITAYETWKTAIGPFL